MGNDSIFTVSNLIRKLKVDMKPTTARVQIPNDCLDGVIDVSAMPSSGPKSKSKAQSNQVVLALKTKSLSGKGKYAIEWYSCNSKDELSHIKSASTRLNESSEPVCLLSDPKDGRGLYVIYNNVNSNTSSFHKLSKSSNSDPILTWNFTLETDMSESRTSVSSRPMSASTSSRSSLGSRIPTPKSHFNANNCLNQSQTEEELLQSNQRLRELVQR